MWRNRGENWRNAWDYEFEWTPEHLTKEQFEPLAFTYDELAAECLDILDKIAPPPPPPPPAHDEGVEPSSAASSTTNPQSSSTSSFTSSSSPTNPEQNSSPYSRDYYTLLKQHHDQDPTLTNLWTQLTTPPPWVDFSQLARGQTVFYRYAGPAIAGLTFQSLLGGMGGYRVVETLARTGGFNIGVARRRLLETFQHVLDITQDIESLDVDGAGFVSSVRVRFLHANVRRRILSLAEKAKQEGKEYFDVKKYGVPINDLDSVGTIAAFSATLIWVSFPRQGIFLTPQEKEDYVALWRYIAYLLGTPDHFFETPEKAKATVESLMMTEIAPTDTSKVLANNIIAALADKPPMRTSRDFLRAESWWLNGAKLSKALEVPEPGWWCRCLVVLQCVVFMGVVYVCRLVPSWDEKRIAKMRGREGRLRRIVLALSGGKEADHGMKYVPALGRMTKGEDAGEEKLLRKSVGVKEAYSKTLVFGGAMLTAAAWLGFRYLSGTSMLWKG